MKCRVYLLLVGMYFINTGLHEPGYGQAPGLRFSEPVESVIADLQAYIPGRMEQADVPGLAVALIQDNQMVWTEGFGVVNRFTQQPVSANTVFEVASISKVITAYTALRYVDRGLFSLDEPVARYMKEPRLS